LVSEGIMLPLSSQKLIYNPIINNLFSRSKSPHSKEIFQKIRKITGINSRNKEVYLLAVTHSSSTSSKYSNERLEYLGDAVLDTVIAEYLFKKYPFKDEGFLTNIRSRIVNRESLNTIARKLGLNEIIQHNARTDISKKKSSIHGNALEALIGAVYIDKGFKGSKKFIYTKIITPHLDIASIVNTPNNFKSILIEWSQKENKKIAFIEEKTEEDNRLFSITVMVEGKATGTASAKNKKKAQQLASEKACKALKVSLN